MKEKFKKIIEPILGYGLIAIIILVVSFIMSILSLDKEKDLIT